MFKKLTVLFVCVLMVISMGVCPAFAEDTVYIFDNSNKIPEESCIGDWGDLWADNSLDHVAFDIGTIPEGNYKITFNGGVASNLENLPMEYTVEVDGNDVIYGFLPWTGLQEGNAGWDKKETTEIGVVSINSDSKRLKFSIVYDSDTSSAMRPSTYGWKITLTRVGDYNKAGSYRFVKSFNVNAANPDSTLTDDKYIPDVYFMFADQYISWNLNHEYEGVYDVVYYGGAMNNSVNNMNIELSVDGKEVLSAEALWTGTDSVDYLGRSIGNAGLYTLKATKLGTIKLTKDAKVIKFTNKGPAIASLLNSRYPRLFFVRTGDITNPTLEAPAIDVVSEQADKKDSRVVIDFAKDIVETYDNLSAISVQNAYGTPSVTVDGTDKSKLIITGVSGSFTVNVGAGLEATDGSMTKDVFSKACYIPSCTVTGTIFFPYGDNLYGRATVNRTSTSVGTNTPVLVWLVLYDENENIVAIAPSEDKNVAWDEQELQASLPNTYLGKFTQAKLLVWEKDLTPIIPAASTGASAFNQ